MVDFLFEQLDGHQLVTELRLEVLDLVVARISLTSLQTALSGGQEVVPPSSEPTGGHAHLARNVVEGLAAEQAEDSLSLPLGAPSALIRSA